ncbi:MAG: VanZ family protein [Bacteroidota bacterium]
MNKYLIGSILWAVLILVLTLTPGKHVPQVGIFDYDKLGHSVIFGILSFLIPFGLIELRKTSIPLKRIIWFSLTFTILYGLILEGMQHFIPGRAMDYVDAIANTAGAMVGVVLFVLINKRRG